MSEKYALMEIISNLLDIKEVRANDFRGVRLPPNDGSVFDYGRGVLGFYAHVTSQEGKFAFSACYYSIDDSGLSIYGPIEDKEKAEERLKKFIKIADQYGKRCPNKDEMALHCQEIGLTPDYW